MAWKRSECAQFYMWTPIFKDIPIPRQGHGCIKTTYNGRYLIKHCLISPTYKNINLKNFNFTGLVRMLMLSFRLVQQWIIVSEKFEPIERRHGVSPYINIFFHWSLSWTVFHLTRRFYKEIFMRAKETFKIDTLLFLKKYKKCIGESDIKT